MGFIGCRPLYTLQWFDIGRYRIVDLSEHFMQDCLKFDRDGVILQNILY